MDHTASGAEQSGLSSLPMSDGKKAEPKYAKGDRAAIVGGKRDIGVRGAVFWIGPNKFGEGMRYGLRGDDGATYWVDENDLGVEENAPPAPERPARDPLSKGDRVKITGGREGLGVTGEIFWVGDSKFGVGLRYGVRGAAEDESYWIDEIHVELVEKGDGETSRPSRVARGDAAGDAGRPARAGASGPPAAEDEAWPSDDDYAAPEDDEIPF